MLTVSVLSVDMAMCGSLMLFGLTGGMARLHSNQHCQVFDCIWVVCLQVSVLNGDKKMTSVIDTTPAGIA